MQHSEYETRRSTLEKQLQEDLDLIRAGYQAKLRALEMLWLAPAATEGAAETRTGEETRAPEPQSPETALASRGGLWEAVQEVLPRLPEIFNRHDVEAALGFTPRKSSLARILRDMVYGEELAVVERSRSRQPARYRKVAGPA